MITRIYAHSAAKRRHGSPNQAIDCYRQPESGPVFEVGQVASLVERTKAALS